MRYSALALAALACAQISVAAMPDANPSSPYFCGSAPPGWTPPWQRKPAIPSGKDAACHLLTCDRQRRPPSPQV
jgi:hypothetical protein